MRPLAHTHISDWDYDRNKALSRRVNGFVENGNTFGKGRKATLMNEDMAKGRVKQAKGRAKKEAGKIAGDKSKEFKGGAEQLAGKIQEEFGKMKQSIHEATKE